MPSDAHPSGLYDTEPTRELFTVCAQGLNYKSGLQVRGKACKSYEQNAARQQPLAKDEFSEIFVASYEYSVGGGRGGKNLGIAGAGRRLGNVYDVVSRSP
jgi:hypothetical protein